MMRLDLDYLCVNPLILKSVTVRVSLLFLPNLSLSQSYPLPTLTFLPESKYCAQ